MKNAFVVQSIAKNPKRHPRPQYLLVAARLRMGPRHNSPVWAKYYSLLVDYMGYRSPSRATAVLIDPFNQTK